MGITVKQVLGQKMFLSLDLGSLQTTTATYTRSVQPAYGGGAGRTVIQVRHNIGCNLSSILHIIVISCHVYINRCGTSPLLRNLRQEAKIRLFIPLAQLHALLRELEVQCTNDRTCRRC